VDSLKETKIDPKVGALVVSQILTLETITYYSDFCVPKDVEQLYKRIHQMGRKDPFLADENAGRKTSHNPNDMYHFLNGVAKNIVCGKAWLVHLIKVRPGVEGWGRLSAGLKETTCLRRLVLNHCYLTVPALEALGKGLKLNSSLEVIDLSFNAMSDKVGEAVVKIIKE
jgi:hypothetical protein